MQDYFVCIYFSYFDDVKLFLALVEMNYLTVISVDNTIEANYRIILYSPSSFSISTKKSNT